MFGLGTNPYTGQAWGQQPAAADWVDPTTGQLKRQPMPWEQAQADAALQKFADDQALKTWQSQMETLETAFKAPAIDTEAIINKGTDEINASERAAALSLGEMGGGAGGRVNGSALAGMQDLRTAFSGQRANLARDTRLGAAGQQADFDLNKARMKMDLLGRKPMLGQASARTSAVKQPSWAAHFGEGNKISSGEAQAYQRRQDAGDPNAQKPFRPGAGRSIFNQNRG